MCVNYPVYLVHACSVWFRLVYSLLPSVSCLCQPCLVLPCPDVFIKDFYLSLLLVSVFLAPPRCVHRDSNLVKTDFIKLVLKKVSFRNRYQTQGIGIENFWKYYPNIGSLFELSIQSVFSKILISTTVFNIDNNVSSNQHIRMIIEGSCDT